MATVLVVGGSQAAAVTWLAWLRADLGERGLWATPEQAAAFVRSMSDPPALIFATEEALLAARAHPALAGTPAVLIGGTLERARALGCRGAVPADVNRASFVAGAERVLRQLEHREPSPGAAAESRPTENTRRPSQEPPAAG